METRPAEVIANIAICLIHQTNYLLDQQLRRLEQDFLEQGGLRERMTRARIAYRNGSYGKNASAGGTNTRQNRATPAPPSSPDPSPTPDSNPSPNSHSSPPRKPRHPGGQP